MRPQLVEDDITQHLSVAERLRRLEQSNFAARLTVLESGYTDHEGRITDHEDRITDLESLRGLVKAAVFVGPWSGTTGSDKTITGLAPGDYLVGVQASAYQLAGGFGGVDFYLNGALTAQSMFFSNESASHKAGNTSWVVKNITGTTLLVQLRNSAPGGVTSGSDGNDLGSVIVIPALAGALF